MVSNAVETKRGDKEMKKLMLMLALFLGVAGLAYAVVRLPVSGLGVAYGPDRDTADQQADQDAQTNMQNLCAGEIVSSRKLGDRCTDNIGSDDNPKYMCTVSYQGMCQVGQ